MAIPPKIDYIYIITYFQKSITYQPLLSILILLFTIYTISTKDNHYLKQSQKLKKIRIERGISQRELAKKIGVRHATLSDMENYKTSPNIDLVIKYALVLNYVLKLEQNYNKK